MSSSDHEEDDLTNYYNYRWSRDWIFFIEGQESKTRMLKSWKPRFLDLMMWTTARSDKRTFVWLQTKATVTSDYIRRLYPTAEWVGSTTGREEAAAWLSCHGKDCNQQIGRYSDRGYGYQEAGRWFMEEMLLADDAVREALDTLNQ